ncbi:hypothetical protein THF5H11_40291 [Vibrio jasicida]|nr:hypothetical protein THF5H11_40291 [Vibrio jasicida]CAH1607981.1 hypothetical protein THF5G08_50194 [Vibrio jasicida]
MLPRLQTKPFSLNLASRGYLGIEQMQHRPDEESRIRHDANHDLFTLFCYIPT